MSSAKVTQQQQREKLGEHLPQFLFLASNCAVCTPTRDLSSISPTHNIIVYMLQQPNASNNVKVKALYNVMSYKKKSMGKTRYVSLQRFVKVTEGVPNQSGIF